MQVDFVGNYKSIIILHKLVQKLYNLDYNKKQRSKIVTNQVATFDYIVKNSNDFTDLLS